ncbi:hypothetical protein [Streptomyces sp. NPDC052701]|uniref:hypothetical protein n=1 Tax=Streptomyces sp. NPDC052701 TaxID=3155533 RepID=UPI00341B0731
MITSSGLRRTPIRLLVLANDALNWSYSIRDGNVVRLVHPEAPMAPVHEGDVAAVAVAAPGGAEEEAVSASLTGPELLPQRRQVELIDEVTGKEIRVQELTDEAVSWGCRV